MVKKWSGTPVTKARAEWKIQIEAGGIVCCRCSKPVLPGDKWQVDHYPISREDGGTQTWPAHAYCNMSAGGKRGAAITNGRKFKKKFSSGGGSRGPGAPHVGMSKEFGTASERGIRGL